MAIQYAVHSVVRGRHNRTERASLPQKPKRKQYIGVEQFRLTHGRPLLITEEYLHAHLEELRAKQAGHILEVRTTDGRKVDLATLEANAALPAAPKPEFQLDSVNNDKNYPGIPGHLLARNVGGDDLTIPEVLKGNEKPALFKDAQAAAEDAEDNDGERPTPPNPMDAAELDALVDAAQVDAAQVAASSDGEAAPDRTAPKAGSHKKRNR